MTVRGGDTNGNSIDFPAYTHCPRIQVKPILIVASIFLPTQTGDYEFFSAYQTEDEKWNSDIELGFGLTEQDKKKTIVVDEPVIKS